MRTLQGIAGGLGLFAAAFALHIVAGGLGQEWLFAAAVALIALIAAGFPMVAAAIAGRTSRPVLGWGTVAGLLLTAGTLWAMNGRAFAAWFVFAAPLCVVAVSGALLMIRIGYRRLRAAPETEPSRQRRRSLRRRAHG